MFLYYFEFLKEAKQILDVKDLNNFSEIEEKFKKMFEMNDKAKGGSFYIQSKVIISYYVLIFI